MEAKLKTLRVADLRELLQRASVPIPAKSNKSDLIAKVLASPAALQAFESQGSSAPVPKPKVPDSSSQAGQEDDLLAPPEEFDWGPTPAANGGAASTTEAAITATTQPASTKIAVPTTSTPEKQRATQAPASKVPVTSVPSDGADAGKTDEELEKRKKRAARFGIPLVETKAKAPPATNGAKALRRAQTAEEASKMEARAARFGMPSTKNPSGGAQKRAHSPAPAEKEEMERRKKRAERFSAGGETNVHA